MVHISGVGWGDQLGIGLVLMVSGRESESFKELSYQSHWLYYQLHTADCNAFKFQPPRPFRIVLYQVLARETTLQLMYCL